MKYFITAIVTFAITIICIAGLLYLKPGLLQGNAKSSQPADSAEQAKINQRLDKLCNDINDFRDMQDILGQLILLSQKLEEDNLYSNARITGLEKKFQDTITKLQQILAGNQDFAKLFSLLAPVETQTNLLTSSDSAFSPELFDNPEFAKLFQKQVKETVKEIEKKKQEEQRTLVTNIINEMIKPSIDDFAKAQNLNEYQHQELNKLVMERSAKTMELFTNRFTQKITGEELRNQQTTVRNESNDKIKQVLLPQQYEEYQKIELQFNRGIMMISGGRNQPRQQQTPSPP